jgi:hypothetical protein
MQRDTFRGCTPGGLDSTWGADAVHGAGRGGARSRAWRRAGRGGAGRAEDLQLVVELLQLQLVVGVFHPRLPPPRAPPHARHHAARRHAGRRGRTGGDRTFSSAARTASVRRSASCSAARALADSASSSALASHTSSCSCAGAACGDPRGALPAGSDALSSSNGLCVALALSRVTMWWSRMDEASLPDLPPAPARPAREPKPHRPALYCTQLGA